MQSDATAALVQQFNLSAQHSQPTLRSNGGTVQMAILSMQRIKLCQCSHAVIQSAKAALQYSSCDINQHLNLLASST